MLQPFPSKLQQAFGQIVVIAIGRSIVSSSSNSNIDRDDLAEWCKAFGGDAELSDTGHEEVKPGSQARSQVRPWGRHRAESR